MTSWGHQGADISHVRDLAAASESHERGAISLVAYNVIVEPYYLENGQRMERRISTMG